MGWSSKWELSILSCESDFFSSVPDYAINLPLFSEHLLKDVEGELHRTVQQFRGQKLFSCRSFPNKSRFSQINLKITEHIFLEWATAIPAMKKPGDFTTFRAGETAHMFAAEIHIFFSDGLPMNPFHSWKNPMGFHMIPATLRSIFHDPWISPCFSHGKTTATIFFPGWKSHRGDQLRAESEALKRQALKLQTEQVQRVPGVGRRFSAAKMVDFMGVSLW